MKPNKRMNKYERRNERQQKMAEALKGEGIYLYENNTPGDLILPKPTKSGIRTISQGRQFQGDSYYLQLVRNNQLKLIKEILSPEQERIQMAYPQKLILDQPDTVTAKGTVEHLLPAEPPKPLNEQQPSKKANHHSSDVLINEDPMAGIVIID